MVRKIGYEEVFNHLIMGTKEQIAVLVRLAFAELLVEQAHTATVVLDDPLVFLDDRRFSRIFDVLKTVARNVQVVVDTCGAQAFEGPAGRQLVRKPVRNEEFASAQNQGEGSEDFICTHRKLSFIRRCNRSFQQFRLFGRPERCRKVDSPNGLECILPRN